MRPNKIKQRWSENKPVTLGWLSIANTFTAELMARHGGIHQHRPGRVVGSRRRGTAAAAGEQRCAREEHKSPRSMAASKLPTAQQRRSSQ